MRVDAVAIGDYNRIGVEPLTGSIGAEITNVDLRELDDELITELHQAWMDHKVLFFRDQPLSHAQHVAYGSSFAPLDIHPFLPRVEEHPEVLIFESSPEAFSAAETWHSDVSFSATPPLGSVLIGRTIPSYGGDTMWANMELAYEMLSDSIKEQIDDAYAVHSYVKAFGRNMTPAEQEAAREEHPDQKHPVVRTHPVTGNKILYINAPFVLTIDGMTPDESRSLRRTLFDQARIPEIQCRFRWQPNSIAQWDNRCTQHYAVPDYGGHFRRMERVTLTGDRPF